MLVYDGDCAFCQWCIDLAPRILPDPVRCEPYQFLDLPSLGLTSAQAASAVWWVRPSVPPRSGHRAIAAVLSGQRAWWCRALGWLIDRPPLSWAAAMIYALVARNRHRLPGGTAQCRLPDATDGRFR